MSSNLIFRDHSGPHITDIVDVAELTELFQSYSDLTGMVTALLDLEGNVLIATNWQDSCTQFHRVGEVTSRRCHESDTALASSLEKGDTYNVYRCRNGLVDVATPVMIDGRHMANFFTGQFFFEKPDLDYFTKQAEEAGFEKEAYLEAINRVPVYDEGTIKSHMAFLVRIAEMVGKAGAANLRAIEANKELEQHREHLQALVDERTAKLKKSLAAAEAANQAKSKFLTNMSHELRTPLNAVLGFSEILSTKEQNPSNKRYLQSINLAGKGLLHLINSVLDMAKIETGKMPVQATPMSLAMLADEVGIVFGKLAAEKDLDLSINVAAQVPEVIQFDETKLRQVLFNLVGNALKFTDRGHVKVHVQGVIKTDSMADLIISVEDTGKGISPADQATIFDAFEQARDQKISEYGGTGLGLSLCKQLVQILGGELTVDSTLGVGSIFQCRFAGITVLPPYTLAAKLQKESRQASLEFSPATLLVVDDNAMNRDLLAAYLSEWDFNVLLAENGRQAIDLAEQYQPDVILMDMKMPVMDGYEATQHLKSSPATSRIPVVAVTASALEAEKEKICKITDEYISKPVTHNALVDCLKRFIPLADKQLKQNAPTNVLIVDDDEINRIILSDMLEEWEDLNISTACSGSEAVELACRTQRPDLILMDCQMPEMDGIEATRRIRAWEQQNQINGVRIIAVTAYTADELQAQGGASLFNGQLTKPFEIEDVEKVLGGYLNNT